MKKIGEWFSIGWMYPRSVELYQGHNKQASQLGEAGSHNNQQFCHFLKITVKSRENEQRFRKLLSRIWPGNINWV